VISLRDIRQHIGQLVIAGFLLYAALLWVDVKENSPIADPAAKGVGLVLQPFDVARKWVLLHLIERTEQTLPFMPRGASDAFSRGFSYPDLPDTLGIHRG